MRFFFLIHFIAINAFATFLPRFEAPVQKISTSRDFVAPNEMYPQKSVPILGESPHGVYVSVGTERGFVGAILSLNVTHLLFVDTNPNVIIFNQINTLLLRLSSDRKDYVNLRYRCPHIEWISRAEELGLKGQELQILQDPEFFKWWRRRVLSSEFYYFNAGPIVQREFFQMANYMRDEIAFRRVHWLAHNDRIAIVRTDLADIARFHEIIEELSIQKIKLSVLDVSNAWGLPFLRLSALLRLLSEFQRIASDRAVFMLTAGSSRKDDLWSYIGFSFDRIENLKSSGPLYRYLMGPANKNHPIKYFSPEDENRLNPPGFLKTEEILESRFTTFLRWVSGGKKPKFSSGGIVRCEYLF